MLKLRQLINVRQCFKSYSTEAATENGDRDFLKELQSKERSLNMVQIIGRVGQDPKVGGLNGEHKQNRVVMFSLATNEYNGTNSDGGIKTRVDWHRVSVSFIFNNC